MTNGDRVDERVCKEARHTIDQQINRNESTDKKAVGLFRLNLLLAGLVITVLTFIPRTDAIGVSQLINIWSVFGIILLFISSIVAAMTYTSSSYDLGITPSLIGRVEDGEFDGIQDLDDHLTDLYKGWLRHNANVGQFNSYLITLAILLLLNSMIFLVLGAGYGLLDHQFGRVMYAALFGLTLIISVAISSVIWVADWVFAQVYPSE